MYHSEGVVEAVSSRIGMSEEPSGTVVGALGENAILFGSSVAVSAKETELSLEFTTIFEKTASFMRTSVAN